MKDEVNYEKGTGNEIKSITTQLLYGGLIVELVDYSLSYNE